jgi:hypothetical protein
VERRITAGLAYAAPWIPIAAAAGIIAALHLPSGAETYQGREVAVLVGLGFAAFVGVAAAIVSAPRSTPQQANSRAYAQVMERLRALRVRIASVGKMVSEKNADSSSGLEEATAHLLAVEERLCLVGPNAPSRAIDPTWASASAYQDLWTGIHRAEEALISYATHDELVAGVASDKLRVAGSPLSKFAPELEKVAADLDRSKAEDAAVASRLRLIRRAINDYRDGRWDGLITARNHLVRSALMTAWTAFSLLLLAVTLGAPRESIAAGAVFFLVGALVGLLAQVRADAKRNDVVEDYGLASARLYQTVLASGLAGVAGVLIMPIAIDVGGASSSTGATLSSVFNVTQNPGQLLLAAVFGLSPQLLFDRLGATADQYKAQLTSTQVSSSGSGTSETAETGEG